KAPRAVRRPCSAPTPRRPHVKILSILMTNPAAAATPPTEAEMERMGAFITELRSKGVLVDTGGRMPGMLELTMARRNGQTTVTDGPFAEAKEVVGGFAM